MHFLGRAPQKPIVYSIWIVCIQKQPKEWNLTNDAAIPLSPEVLEFCNQL